MLLLKLMILTGVYYVSAELFRRGGFWLTFVLFCIVPIALTPWWIQINPNIGWFPWVKLYSVSLAITWMAFARFTELGRKSWWRQGVACLLIVNIIEALVQDIAGQNLAHSLVVISGILLVVTLPKFRHSIQIDMDSRHLDMTFVGMNRKWIIEYTIWNAAFVFLNFPQIAGHQIVVLLAALIVGMIRPDLWLQARGYTLGTSLLLLATFSPSLVAWTNTEHWSNPLRANLVSFVCLVIMLGYTIRFAQLHWSNQRAAGSEDLS